MSILDYFEGVPRAVQRDFLLAVEKHWLDTDVFLGDAPVAAGKSKIATCLAKAKGPARIVTPTNILIDQYAQSTDIAVVKSAKHFACDKGWGTCNKAPLIKGKKKYCLDCPYKAQYGKARHSKNSISTYQMLLAFKKHYNLHIFDEGHKIVNMIQDANGKKLWPFRLGIPEDKVDDLQTLMDWLRTVEVYHPGLKWLKQELLSDKPLYVAEIVDDVWSGGGEVYGEKYAKGQMAETRCVRLYPTSLKNVPKPYWGADTKLVFLSATMSSLDLKTLGIPKYKRIVIPSPIPVERRPVVKDYVAKLSRNSSDEVIAEVAQRIKDIAEKHSGESGLVHVTYALARKLRPLLEGDDRFVFHTASNKSRRLAEFKTKPGTVFVASGLSEGLSLDYDLARWQIITKIPWLYLGHPLNRHHATHNEEFYHWSTAKEVIQASGRVSRTPDDYGITYILDESFERLLNKAGHLFPKWFLQGLESA